MPPAVGAEEDSASANPAEAAEQPLPHEAAADDPDTQLVLGLFPERIRAAMVEALGLAEAATEAAGATGVAAALPIPLPLPLPLPLPAGGQAAAGSSAAAPAAGRRAAAERVQLVEVVVDLARPVRLRLSTGKELELQEELSVPVSACTLKRW